MKCDLISWMTWEIYLLSSGNHLYMFHLNGTSKKIHQHHLDQCRFLIRLWISLSSNCQHAIIVSILPTLTSFYFVCVLMLVFVWLSHVNHFSFSLFLTFMSQTLTPVSIHLFCCALLLFSRNIVLGFLSWHFHVFFSQRIYFRFLITPFLDTADRK